MKKESRRMRRNMAKIASATHKKNIVKNKVPRGGICL